MNSVKYRDEQCFLYLLVTMISYHKGFCITFANFSHLIIDIFSVLSLRIVYLVTVRMALKAQFVRGEGKARE